MLRKTVSGMMLALLFIGMLTLAFKIEVVRAAETIYIRADGSIDPPTAPISTLDNITYTLTGNITDSISVERSNITIDGDGFMLLGSSTLKGINMVGLTNVTIRNMNIRGFYTGVLLDSSSNCTVSHSNITGGWAPAVWMWDIGINVDRANYNTLSNNNVSNCFYGIQFSNSSGNFVVNSSIEDCEVNIVFQDSPHNNVIGNEIVNTFGIWLGGILLLYSPNNTISGNIFTDSSIFVGGETLDDFMQSIDSSNIIDGKNAYYITNQNGLQVSPITHPLTYVLGLINSTRVRIEGFALPNALPIAYTNKSSITNSTLKGGIWLTASSNNDITNCTLNGGISLSDSSNNVISLVTAATGEITLKKTSCHNIIQDSDIANIDIDDSSNKNSIARNNIHGGWNDASINVDSEYNNITRNKITSLPIALTGYPENFAVSLASNNNVKENIITNCTIGIATENFTKIEMNYVTNCSIGVISIAKHKDGWTIPATCDTGILLSGNNITHCDNGIRIDGWLNCTISGNRIESNDYGIYGFSSSSNNTIYNNNFLNNTRQASVRGAKNSWDNGYPSAGNYWSDYNGTDIHSGYYQNITGSDGVGDTSYLIDVNNIDNYPLMGMFSDFNATTEYHVQTICNSSISDFQFNGTAISFDVTGISGTIGFCRICIPNALMNVTYKVFVNGTEVSYSLLPCSNETYSYLYFSYTHSTQEVIIIPEFPSFLILLLFLIATLPAVIVYRRKLSM